MRRFKFLGAFILGIGIALLSSNITMAETNKDEKNSNYIIEIAVVDEELAKKQEEIEYILFNTNNKEIESKGFKVLSTGMVNKFVEVRIEPYNEENAEYLYDILGRDKVKVVGEQGSVTETPSDSTDSSESSPTFSATAINEDMLNKQREIDIYLLDTHKDEIAEKGFEVTNTAPFENYVEIGIMPYNEENAEYLYNIFGRDIVKVVEGRKLTTIGDKGEVQYAEDYNTTTNSNEYSEKDNMLLLPLLIVSVLALGGVTFLVSKRKVNYKR